MSVRGALKFLKSHAEDSRLESPQEISCAYAKVIDDLRRFGKRAEYLRDAELTLAETKAKLEEVSQRQWAAFGDLSLAMRSLPPPVRLIELEKIDAVLSKRVDQLVADFHISTGVIEDVAKAAATPDLPDFWLSRALSYVAKPKEIELVDAVMQLEALLKLILEVAPHPDSLKARLLLLDEKLVHISARTSFISREAFSEPKSSVALNAAVLESSIGKALPYD
ncbi:MAG TPA: hypothetical protein VGO49_04190 [Bradyrhizobium sp.]|jgi:hypothetical protein|nr:hypothetical protein [Bradyrhizobium sp.]